MDLLKGYLDLNRRSLLIYIGISLLFYIFNFAVFRDSIDAPVDLVFTVIYIFGSSGIVVFFIFLKSDISTSNDKFILLFINLFIPFLISFVFGLTYWVIEMQDSATLGNIIIISGASFPLMFLAVIMIMLFKDYKMKFIKILGIGIVVFVLYWLTLLGLGAIENQIEDSIYTIIGYLVLFFAIPFGYMMYLVIGLDKTLY